MYNATNLSKKADLSNYNCDKCHFFMEFTWHTYCTYKGVEGGHMKILTTITILLVMMTGVLFAEDIEVSGEVVSVDEITDSETDTDVLQARIRLQTREMIEAHLCPSWYLDEDLAPEDQVTLIGKYGEDGEFKVREVIRNEVRREIRDEDYTALWLKTQLQSKHQFYNPEEEIQTEGTVEDLYVETNTSMMEAKVMLESGETVRVRLAPEWYLRNQLRIGDDVELIGDEVEEDGMIMAREVRNLRTNLEIGLRTKQGAAQWPDKIDRKREAVPSSEDKPIRKKP